MALGWKSKKNVFKFRENPRTFLSERAKLNDYIMHSRLEFREKLVEEVIEVSSWLAKFFLRS